MARWNFDAAAWPGPSRAGSLLHDVIFEHPSGERAVVFYSCAEVGDQFKVGRLALLSGDPDRPNIDLVAQTLVCQVTAVIWLTDRYTIVRLVLFDPELEQTEMPLCFLDLQDRVFTIFPFEADARPKVCEASGSWYVEQFRPSSEKRQGQALNPSDLKWLPWSEILSWQRMYLADYFGRPTSYRRAMQDRPGPFARWLIRTFRTCRQKAQPLWQKIRGRQPRE